MKHRIIVAISFIPVAFLFPVWVIVFTVHWLITGNPKHSIGGRMDQFAEWVQRS